MLSRRALSLKPSPTLAMANRARELTAAGMDVVSLTVGEPDWPTFEVAKAAGIKAIQDNFSKYTAAAGIPELKSAIAALTSRELGVSYAAAEVAVGAGAKFVIFAALQMLCNPGDEVIIPTPYWVSYPTMVELADGVPVIVPCDAAAGFKLSAAALEKAITPRTRALILCSPSNPTGIVYSAAEIAAIGEVLLRHPSVTLISDDIYNSLYFASDVVAPHVLHSHPSLKERILVVNGASKAFSMTGWRVGWALGPKPLIAAMADYMSQSTSNPASISQMAVLAAVREGAPELRVARKALWDRKNWFLEKMSAVPGFRVIDPQGAFYFWTDVSAFFGTPGISGSKDVSEVLLDKYHVATVPGVEFGSEGYIRLSFATSQASLQKAADRFAAFAKAQLG